ncbi:MAG: Periplasmic copper-binding protein, partial [Parcubacteria group bacterium GW2011_GWA2_47_8]
NTALQAAYAGGRGGKVYLMEGDYYLSTGAGDKIQMATSTSLIGAGQSTVIHIASSTNATANAIAANTLSYITIADLFIDGNKGRNSGAQNGISFTSVSTSTIRNVTVATTTNIGIYLSSSSGNTVTGNSANNSQYGIRLSSSNNNTIIGNTANSNTNYGIYFSLSSSNILTANTANGNVYGIYLAVSNNNTFTANSTNNNTNYGITLDSSSNNNTLTANSINSNSNTGIYLNSANNNTLTGNSLYDNTGSSAGSSIFVSSSNNNIISSNRIQDTAGTGYAINISSSGSAGNTLTGNYYSGIGASSINDLGTNTKYTQWDRLTLDTAQLGQVAYSPLSIFASSSVALASTTQMGSGKIMSLNNAVGEMFTVANGGNVGIGTSSPYAKLSVAGEIVGAYFTATTTATSTLAGDLSVREVKLNTNNNAYRIYADNSSMLTLDNVYDAGCTGALLGNTFLGLSSGIKAVLGSCGTTGNTGIGYLSLTDTTGNYNTASGRQSLRSNTTGSSNTANGTYSHGVQQHRHGLQHQIPRSILKQHDEHRQLPLCQPSCDHHRNNPHHSATHRQARCRYLISLCQAHGLGWRHPRYFKGI